MFGSPITGIAAVVTAAVALIEALTESGKDAGQSFTGKPVSSPTASCPDTGAHLPESIQDGAKAVVNSNAYKGCPDSVKNQIASKDFTADEKAKVEDVLEKYKPLMKCENTPLKQIGRTDKAITKNGGCVAETSTMGEWFKDQGTLVLTDGASVGTDFKDPSKQFQGTAAHEMAHAMFNNFDPKDCKEYANALDNPLMKDFMKTAGWDSTGGVLTETAGDACPTAYGKTNPQEDMSESAMLYLYEPDTLKEKSPARYEFMKKLFGD